MKSWAPRVLVTNQSRSVGKQTELTQTKMKTYTRRDFVSLAIAAPLFGAALPAIARASSATVKISSPNGRIELALLRDLYPVISLQFRNTYVLSARLGMTVDGVD